MPIFSAIMLNSELLQLSLLLYFIKWKYIYSAPTLHQALNWAQQLQCQENRPSPIPRVAYSLMENKWK